MYIFIQNIKDADFFNFKVIKLINENQIIDNLFGVIIFWCKINFNDQYLFDRY